MLRQWHGLSPLVLGGRLVHTPDEYLVAVTVFRVVDVGIVNKAATIIIS